LDGPKTSVSDDALFLSDVTEVDPRLVTYEKQFGNIALRSLLTDGSAFCAFLHRDRDIDTAMVSVAVGARQVAAQSHLPMTVTTFNAVDSVALLTLCPSLESELPVSDLTKIRRLGAALAVPSS
jgi:predicted solute-binding protein